MVASQIKKGKRGHLASFLHDMELSFPFIQMTLIVEEVRVILGIIMPYKIPDKSLRFFRILGVRLTPYSIIAITDTCLVSGSPEKPSRRHSHGLIMGGVSAENGTP